MAKKFGRAEVSQCTQLYGPAFPAEVGTFPEDAFLMGIGNARDHMSYSLNSLKGVI